MACSTLQFIHDALVLLVGVVLPNLVLFQLRYTECILRMSEHLQLQRQCVMKEESSREVRPSEDKPVIHLVMAAISAKWITIKSPLVEKSASTQSGFLLALPPNMSLGHLTLSPAHPASPAEARSPEDEGERVSTYSRGKGDRCHRSGLVARGADEGQPTLERTVCRESLNHQPVGSIFSAEEESTSWLGSPLQLLCVATSTPKKGVQTPSASQERSSPSVQPYYRSSATEVSAIKARDRDCWRDVQNWTHGEGLTPPENPRVSRGIGGVLGKSQCLLHLTQSIVKLLDRTARAKRFGGLDPHFAHSDDSMQFRAASHNQINRVDQLRQLGGFHWSSDPLQGSQSAEFDIRSTLSESLRALPGRMEQHCDRGGEYCETVQCWSEREWLVWLLDLSTRTSSAASLCVGQDNSPSSTRPSSSSYTEDLVVDSFSRNYATDWEAESTGRPPHAEIGGMLRTTITCGPGLGRDGRAPQLQRSKGLTLLDSSLSLTPGDDLLWHSRRIQMAVNDMLGSDAASLAERLRDLLDFFAFSEGQSSTDKSAESFNAALVRWLYKEHVLIAMTSYLIVISSTAAPSVRMSRLHTEKFALIFRLLSELLYLGTHFSTIFSIAITAAVLERRTSQVHRGSSSSPGECVHCKPSAALDEDVAEKSTLEAPGRKIPSLLFKKTPSIAPVVVAPQDSECQHVFASRFAALLYLSYVYLEDNLPLKLATTNLSAPKEAISFSDTRACLCLSEFRKRVAADQYNQVSAISFLTRMMSPGVTCQPSHRVSKRNSDSPPGNDSIGALTPGAGVMKDLIPSQSMTEVYNHVGHEVSPDEDAIKTAPPDCQTSSTDDEDGMSHVTSPAPTTDGQSESVDLSCTPERQWFSSLTKLPTSQDHADGGSCSRGGGSLRRTTHYYRDLANVSDSGSTESFGRHLEHSLLPDDALDGSCQDGSTTTKSCFSRRPVLELETLDTSAENRAPAHSYLVASGHIDDGLIPSRRRAETARDSRELLHSLRPRQAVCIASKFSDSGREKEYAAVYPARASFAQLGAPGGKHTFRETISISLARAYAMRRSAHAPAAAALAAMRPNSSGGRAHWRNETMVEPTWNAVRKFSNWRGSWGKRKHRKVRGRIQNVILRKLGLPLLREAGKAVFDNAYSGCPHESLSRYIGDVVLAWLLPQRCPSDQEAVVQMPLSSRPDQAAACGQKESSCGGKSQSDTFDAFLRGLSRTAMSLLKSLDYKLHVEQEEWLDQITERLEALIFATEEHTGAQLSISLQPQTSQVVQRALRSSFGWRHHLDLFVKVYLACFIALNDMYFPT